jgi:hypothetical protein
MLICQSRLQFNACVDAETSGVGNIGFYPVSTIVIRAQSHDQVGRGTCERRPLRVGYRVVFGVRLVVGGGEPATLLSNEAVHEFSLENVPIASNDSTFANILCSDASITACVDRYLG